MDNLKPYEHLARSVVALAAVDYKATQHGGTMAAHVQAWINMDHHGNIPGYLNRNEWLKRKRNELLEFFDNGGGELARAANAEHYIRWALRKPISRKAAANVSRKNFWGR